MKNIPEKLFLSENNFISYHKHDGKNNQIGIIFLSGFMSDMYGIKATALEEFCKIYDYPYVRFDYFGHGKSSKAFTECTIGDWKQNILDVIDKIATGKQVLVGSSMGGWLMLLAARERSERIAGLVGIASAPDFTDDLIWHKMTKVEQDLLLKEGIYNLKSDFSDNPYPVTLRLIEEARSHLLLQSKEDFILSSELFPSPINISLIHGKKDMDVPSSVSVNLASKLKNHNVKLTLVEDGDHRMSTPNNIELLKNELQIVLKSITT